MIDAYSVLSNEGINEDLYSSYLGLVPDYGVGFVILSADTVRLVESKHRRRLHGSCA
jgi:hypothetical protein